MKIGELARRTRTNAPTIRYYEEIGLLPAPARRDGGQRSYGDGDSRRLTFIRQCRAFGFPIEQVRSLVALTEDQDRSCTEARSIAQVHLDAVRDKAWRAQAPRTQPDRFHQALRRCLLRWSRTRLRDPAGYGGGHA